MITLAQYKEQFQKLRGRQEFLEKELTEKLQLEDKLMHKLMVAEKARKFLLEVAERIQSRLEYRISYIVTTKLAAVFDKPEEFLVKFVQRRDQTECDLMFVKGGRKMDPLGFTGGGVLDVTCAGLRLTFLTLSSNRRVMISDEPYRNLHGVPEQVRCSEITKMLSSKLGYQIIMVSDVQEINSSASKVFTVELGSTGISSVN